MQGIVGAQRKGDLLGQRDHECSLEGLSQPAQAYPIEPSRKEAFPNHPSPRAAQASSLGSLQL